jgi:hypothetical protein
MLHHSEEMTGVEVSTLTLPTVQRPRLPALHLDVHADLRQRVFPTAARADQRFRIVDVRVGAALEDCDGRR